MRKIQKFISRAMIRTLRIVGQVPLVGDAIVKASFDAVRQTWGERSWMFQSLQDSWLEIDALSRKELQRIHEGLIENSCIVQKIRSLFLQFSVGPSGLICTPNASRMSATGNTPESKESVENWNHARGEAWERWWRTPELNDSISGSQLTRVWSGLLFDKGEIFVNLTQDERGRPRVQTIDAHRCETPYDTKEFQGRAIVDGVEMTEAGQVVAYWFKKTNFEGMLTVGIQGEQVFDRIPVLDKRGRKQLIHKFKVRRPGQKRGIPEGFSVYNLVRDNMDLHKLEMQAAKLASDIANVEINPTGELDALSNRRSRMAVGSLNAAGQITNKQIMADYKVSIGAKNIAMREGSSLSQFMIARPTVATQDYWDLHYTLICMGYGVPKLLVMPYSLQGTVTRADLDISGYGFGREHFEIIAELLCEVYEWQTEWTVKRSLELDGATPEDYLSVVIRPPRAPNVDVGYSAKAVETELHLGIKTVPDIYAEKQQDFRQKTREIAEYLKYVNDLAKEFEVDPAQITSLIAQQVKPGQTNPEDPEKTEDPEASFNIEKPKPQHAIEPMAFLPVVRGANRLEVKNENTSEAAEIILIGAVGKNWWDDSGITEQEVRDALKSIPKGRKINARINSEGGSVKEGLGIYNAFKERRDDITAHVTGYALSIASVFPLGAGKVISPKSAIWMMHKAWAWNQGNADDMRQAAEMLDAHDETLVDVYAAETGKSKKDIRAAMEAETWIKGSAAVDFGLADETDTESDEAEASYRPIDRAVLARCKNIPREIFNALSAAPSGGQQTKQPENIMNKKIVVALLKRHGIEASETETEEQLQAKLEKIPLAAANPPTPAPTPAPAAPSAAADDIAAIKKQLADEKKARIQGRVETYVEAQKITVAEVPIFVAAALADEAATFKILDEKEVQTPGGEPAGAFFEINELMPAPLAMNKNGVQGSKITPELDNIFATTATVKERGDDGAPTRAIARYERMKAEWPQLLRAAFRKDNGVQAANTFSATITTNFLILGVTVKLYNRFAAARLFTKDAEQDPYKPLAAGVRKFNTTTTDGTQVQTDPTDFEGLGAGGDSTIDPITVTPHQYVSGGHITNAQLNSGFRVADIVEAKLVDLGAKITQVMTAPITTANFTTNAALVSAPAAFGFSDLADLQGTLKKSLIKNLLLDGEYIARISNTPGFFQMAGTVGGSTGAWAAFGWDNIALNTDWSGAGANVRGFACNPQAIGTITGLPLNPPEGIPGNIVQTGVAMLPDNQLGIATYAWFSAASRTFFFTYDMIAGATLLDETAGRLIKSA